MSMWAPFSEPARRSIVFAHEVAQRFGNNIEAEHIVVGAFGAGDSAAYDALISFGVTPEGMNEAAERTIKRGTAVSQEMIFTPCAKRVIERAFEEARRLKHRYIGAEHVLLAYLGEYGAGSELLRQLEIDPQLLRAKVLELLPQRANEHLGPQSAASEPPASLERPSLEQLFGRISRLDQLGVQSATEQGSERRLYYIDAEGFWHRLQGAMGRRDVVGSLLYAFIVAHREGRTAEQLIHEVWLRLEENYKAEP